MKTTKYFALFLFSIILISASNISAQKRMGGKNMHHKDRMLSQLNLSEEQLKQFNDFQYAHQKEAIELQAQIKQNRNELQKMLKDGNINTTEILNLTRTQSDLQAKLKESAVKMWIDIYNILTPEQQKTWSNKLPMMGENFGNERMMRENDRPAQKMNMMK